MTEPAEDIRARSWESIQATIDACRLCEQANAPFLRVPTGRKRHPPFSPPTPTRILFVSVAPPWGGDYFWAEGRPDAVREGLFQALNGIGNSIRTCQDFWSARYFLVPGVKCPSESGGNDHLPSSKARDMCANHLRSEIFTVAPERILALGREAMASISSALGLNAPRTVSAIRRSGPWWATVGGQIIPVAGTYFPGNNRHNGLAFIGPDIQALLQSAHTRSSG
jgi:uracil-DNA glycosylase